MHFVDTNIFIRFLTRDDKVKAKKCYQLFNLVSEGKIKLTTTESVIAETVYILCSKSLYNLTPNTISELLIPLISLRGLTLPYKLTIRHALRLYSQFNLDFEDVLLIAHMSRTKTAQIYSYDKGLDQIPHIQRLEP